MISAYTETSESRDAGFRGWIFYDGDCAFCTGLVKRFGPSLLKHGYRKAQLQTPWVRERLGFCDAALLTEMHLLTACDELYGGADALIQITTTVWWAKPFALLARLPGLHALLHAGYRSFAGRRHCLAGGCSVNRPHRWLKWLGLAILPLLALLFTDDHAPWIMMWSLALGVGVGCKWLTFSNVNWHQVSFRRTLAYLFAWPGMDPRPFFKNEREAIRTGLISGGLCIISGAVLLWIIARHMSADLLIGWVGMIALVLLLHFGAFRLLAYAWRRVGVAVAPIMKAPLAAGSVSEFWARRWNIAFHQLTHEFVFRPLHKQVGAPMALVAGFLASGLVHDLVISVPARAGYGLPTAYFLLQAIAVLLERRINLHGGWRGRVFLIFATFLPAFFLFHPPFIHRVFLPFMRGIGAL